MILKLNNDHLSDNTERYQNTGLQPKIVSDILQVVEAIKKAGYEPYDQLTGYVRTGNERYITRKGNARDMALHLDIQDIKAFLREQK